MDMELFGERFSVTAATDTGPRRENQDTFAWVAVTSGEMVGSAPKGDLEPVPDDRPDLLVAVVCDGMGGMNAGAEASAIATRSIVERAKGVHADDHDAFVGSVVDAIADADQMLEALYPGTGTTVSVIVASHGIWTSIHLGDSRCYAVYPDRVWRTNDHSPVEAMRLSGLIDEDEMNEHPMSNLVSYFAGGGFSDRTEVEDLETGWSRMILCSDGAFGYMPPEDFRALAGSAEDAESIVHKALEMGGRDNTTVLQIRRNRTVIIR